MSVTSSRCGSVDSKPPAMTRESTNTNTGSVLPTPMDYPCFGGSSTSKTLAPPFDNAMIRMASQDGIRLTPGHVGSIVSSQQDADQELPPPPVDSYFPPTRSPATPTRNNSTKELINRYETMNLSPHGTFGISARSSVASPLSSRYASPLSDPAPSGPLSVLKERSRSPLRDSLRNLVSLFGKKGKDRDDDGSSFVSSRYESSVSASPANAQSVVASPQSHARSPLSTDDRPPLRSGPVLYLAQPNTDSTLPVWTNCKASLKEDRILLEWLTAYGNPSCRTIMLKKSTDVHSLAKSQVDPVEKSLLPLTGQDAYIFEMTCPGGTPEKFAMSSVSERSAWVSCIWDVLLKLERNDEIEELVEVGKPLEPVSHHIALPQESSFGNIPIPPRLSTLESSSASMSRGYSTTSDAASSTLVAQSVIESITMRTGRSSAQLASETISVPPTPTKIIQSTSRAELLTSRFSSHSTRSIENLSIVQDRLSMFTENNTNRNYRNISRVPTQLSRRSSVASVYSNSPSRAPTHLVTPQSLPKTSSRTSQVPIVPLSRAASIGSKYEEEQTFYDFYAQPSFISRLPSPVPKISETQIADTARAFITTSASIDLLSRPVQETAETANEQRVLSDEMVTTLKNERPLPDLPKSPGRKTSHDATNSCIVVLDEPGANGEEESKEVASVHPLIALIQDHAAQHHNQTASIGTQLASLQQDILGMSKELRTVIEEQDPGTALRGVLEDLCVKMDGTAAANGVGMQELHQKIDLIVDQLSTRNRTLTDSVPRPPSERAPQSQSRPVAQSAEESAPSSSSQAVPEPPSDMNEAISDALANQPAMLEKLTASIDEARDIVKSDMPFIKEKLSSIVMAATAPVAPVVPVIPDTSQIIAKLDELLELYRSLQTPGSNVEPLVDCPIEPPIKPSAEPLAEPPAEPPVEPPVEHSIVAPVECSFAPPVERSFAPPVERSVAPPVEHSVVPPVERSFIPPVEAPIELPVESPLPPNKDPSPSQDLRNLGIGKDIEESNVGESTNKTLLGTSTSGPAEAANFVGQERNEKAQDKVSETKAEDKSLSIPPQASDIESKLSEVLSLLKSEHESKKLGAEQQAENVRYLQELNTWLESFVTNGTTQIQTVAQGVEKLCQELAPAQHDVGNGEDAGPVGPIGIRSELGALAANVKAGEERDNALQALATETLQIMKNKEAESNTFDMNVIVQMIEQQKQEQQHLLRALANELSNDIRGERLRFVEAMKEATAINVQAHVEEFKKELGKEVMMMTCEVGRLQRERQALEQQIADLFAFFAKQRAEMEQNQAEMAQQRLQVQQQAVQATPAPARSNSARRPLPVPKQ